MATIAVVNDDPQFLRLMELILQDEGHNVLPIQKQSTAFPDLLSSTPDLIILDLHMDTDDAGWIILDLVRLDASTANIPVIVCSAAHDELARESERIEQYGARVLRKPFDIDELLLMVRECLGLAG